MRNWWQLGEGIGYAGSDLSLYLIECPFCEEKGNFERVFHADKKKPNGTKTLNFDTYKCGNCAGYIQVVWSATDSYGSHGLHSFRVQPWPMKTNSVPEHWPPQVQRFWLRAVKSLESENWDATVLMARSALQATMRDLKAKKGSLKDEIENLAIKGLLPPIMREWADELRTLGNESAHPDSDSEPADPDDANDIIEYLSFLLKYSYDLPLQISEYRKRKNNKSTDRK